MVFHKRTELFAECLLTFSEKVVYYPLLTVKDLTIHRLTISFRQKGALSMNSKDKSCCVPTGRLSVTDTMRLFITVNRMHHIQVERRVACLGIHHSQHRMLMYLSHCDAMPSQRELADAMGISPAAVTATLKCLEKEGYISREMTAEDNRRNRVCITEEGRRKVSESHAIFESVDSTTFDGFTEEELSDLRTLLSRMLSNLASEETLPENADKT